jgi:crotonobetainyl-CoA:carnitine CoA-transferase CaiB-like acyl-CoA transferase
VTAGPPDSGPFSGTVVVDMSRALAGPYATQMLADLGARVIKVEHPVGGDESRSWGPPFIGAENTSTYYLSCNRNKESVTADLKTAEGKTLVEDLIAAADVLVENFRPGVLDRLDLSLPRLRERNPNLIVCSITGFGHDGPESQRAGYDQILQGEAGLMSLTGPSPNQPTKVGVPIADLLAGMNAAFAIASALFERSQTGTSHVVRTSLLASLTSIHTFQGTRWTLAGEMPVAEGNAHPSIAPYGLFEAQDGHVQIACGNDAAFGRLSTALDLPKDDPRFKTNADRVANRPALTDLINAQLRGRPLSFWVDLLGRVGVPIGRIRNIEEVYEWDQAKSQGLLVEVNHPTLGVLRLPGSAIRFDDHPRPGGRPTHTHPPLLGEHNERVREWLDSVKAMEATHA